MTQTLEEENKLLKAQVAACTTLLKQVIPDEMINQILADAVSIQQRLENGVYDADIVRKPKSESQLH